MNAAEVIGKQGDDDWILEPEKHAQLLPPQAGALQRVLKGTAVSPLVVLYLRSDKEAIRFQALYKKWGRREILLSAAAAFIGASILYLAGSAVEDTWKPYVAMIRTPLLLVQAGCVAAVATVKHFLQQGKFFQKWMQERSKAESVRIEYFETILGMRKVGIPRNQEEGEMGLLPLQLEYFRRYQLEMQMKFYCGRASEHDEAARKTLGIGAWITFGAALAAAIGGLRAELGDWVSSAAIVGLVAPILLGMQTSISRLNQNEQIAGRYKITEEHLRRCYQHLGEARTAAEKGDREPVFEFVERVHGVLSTEHQEWLKSWGEGCQQKCESDNHPARDVTHG